MDAFFFVRQGNRFMEALSSVDRLMVLPAIDYLPLA